MVHLVHRSRLSNPIADLIIPLENRLRLVCRRSLFRH